MVLFWCLCWPRTAHNCRFLNSRSLTPTSSPSWVPLRPRAYHQGLTVAKECCALQSTLWTHSVFPRSCSHLSCGLQRWPPFMFRISSSPSQLRRGRSRCTYECWRHFWDFHRQWRRSPPLLRQSVSICLQCHLDLNRRCKSLSASRQSHSTVKVKERLKPRRLESV